MTTTNPIERLRTRATLDIELCHEAADTIEAQARQIEQLRAALAQTKQPHPHDVLGKQEPLGADFAKVLHDSLDSLYEETEQSHGQISKVIGVGLEYRPDEHDRGYWKEEDGICLEYEDGYRDCFYISEIFATHKPAEPVNQVQENSVSTIKTWKERCTLSTTAQGERVLMQSEIDKLRARLAQVQRAKREPLSDEQFKKIKTSLRRQDGFDGDGWDLALKERIEAAHGITKGQ